MIQGLLKNEGIPSLLQATGVDAPTLGITLLPPSPQRVMVHAEQAETARRLLAETVPNEAQDAEVEVDYLDDAGRREPRNYGVVGAYARSWFWSLLAIGIAFLVFLILRGG